MDLKYRAFLILESTILGLRSLMEIQPPVSLHDFPNLTSNLPDGFEILTVVYRYPNVPLRLHIYHFPSGTHLRFDDYCFSLRMTTAKFYILGTEKNTANFRTFEKGTVAKLRFPLSQDPSPMPGFLAVLDLLGIRVKNFECSAHETAVAISNWK